MSEILVQKITNILTRMGIGHDLPYITGMSYPELEVLFHTVHSFVDRLSGTSEEQPTNNDVWLNAAVGTLVVYCSFKTLKEKFNASKQQATIESSAPKKQTKKNKKQTTVASNTDEQKSNDIDKKVDSIDLTDSKPVFRPDYRLSKPFQYWHVQKCLTTIEDNKAFGLAMTGNGLRLLLSALDPLPGDDIVYTAPNEFQTVTGRPVKQESVNVAAAFCINYLQAWLNQLEVTLATTHTDLGSGNT